MTENMGGDIPALAAALAKAQGKIAPAEKDRENPHFRSHYATLASVWEAVRVPLSENGLSVVQMPSTDGNLVSVRTVLLHTSGGWLASECSSIAKDASPQPVGSCITYLRRYGLAAMLGVVADEDDDANTGQSPAPKHEAAARTFPPRPTGNGSSNVPSTAQLNLISRLKNDPSLSDEDRNDVAERVAAGLTRQGASDMIERLNNIIKGVLV